MVPALRKAFNSSFNKDKYESFLQDLNSKHPGAIEFRVAETPVFIDKSFGKKLIDACESIVDVIVDPSFKSLTERAIPKSDSVPNENDHTHMIAFDFGICVNEKNELEPQLIEMQGFPTLFGFQIYYPEIVKKHFPVPSNYTQYLADYDRKTYLRDLWEVIVGDHPVENVILLEIKPHEQKTRIDFYCTQDYLGIQPVCISELIKEGKDLYYINAATGKKTPVKRIYNRVIFDDLECKQGETGKLCRYNAGPER